MSAQSWSVKGIDPKVREAVREAAAKQGMSLGEYLNQALQKESEAQERGGGGAGAQRLPVRPRTTRIASSIDDMDDWLMSAPTDMTRNADPARLSQRIDAIERRTQLAVTGLDRAVSTIDRSVLGLAGRVDDAETIARESADRVSEALEQFREAGEILSGRLNQAETEARQSRQTLEQAAAEIIAAREEMGARVTAVDEIARKAEADARRVALDLDERHTALLSRIDEVDHETKYAIGSGLSAARAAAEAAAREAAATATGAVEQLRALHDTMSHRLEEAESGNRRLVESAIEDFHGAHDALAERVARSESDLRRAQETLAERVAGVETASRFAVEEAANEIRAAQAALAQRLERAEQSGREATAGLRQAAGSAIADLRNAQLGLSARLKLVEENAGAEGGADLSEVHAAQAALDERLARLERAQDSFEPEMSARIEALEARPAYDPTLAERIAKLEAEESDPAVQEALARFEQRLADFASRPAGTDDALHARLDEIWSRLGAHEAEAAEAVGAARTLEESLERLAARIAETENTANNAIRTLEETVAGLGAQIAATDTHAETEALRALLEQRVNDLAQSVEATVQGVRAELVERIETANSGVALDETQIDGLEGALADVNRRLAAAERRQAQTIEAISVEIKRMSETVDRRLRAVEDKDEGDASSATAVREEVARLARALEGRFEEIERREAAAFDRMGLEVGRLSERLEDRFASVETRSAQAIEQVGEQVARMAERFNQRQDSLARELGERVIDSEERANARISDAISGLMQRLSEVEEHSVEAVTPVARAMSSVASRLQALEDNEPDDIPTPARRESDAAPPPPPEADEDARAMFGEAPETPAPPFAPEADDADYFDLADDEDDAPFDPPPAPTVHAAPEEPPVRAHPLPPHGAQETKALDEDKFLEIAEEIEAGEGDDADPFWTDEADDAELLIAEPDKSEDDLFAKPLPPADPEPPAKNDYLAAARRAAQTQNPQPKAGKPAKEYATQPYSLRGSSRVVLWGAAGAIALLVAGGAYLMNERGNAREEAVPLPPEGFEPVHPPAPAEAIPPEATADEGAHEGAPLDAPAHVAPDAPGVPAPMADAAPHRPPGAASQAVAVAQPLPPRAVSLESAANSGDAVAQYELALQRISAGRAADGVTLLRQAANQGLAMAQYRLAKLYERGEGVPADLTQARAWTERAAAAGNRRAMHDLGVYFARGEGAPLDEAAAFRWFRQAAELGVADSQFNLGVLYQQGRGVNANPSEALFWYLVAARQGDTDAGARATALEATLQPIQVEQARARAEAFRPRAASARANGEFGPRPWAAAQSRGASGA